VSARPGRLGHRRREEDEDQDQGDPNQQSGPKGGGDEVDGVALHVSV
jgi:hypothetical protein